MGCLVTPAENENPFADGVGRASQSFDDVNANPFADSHDKVLEADDDYSETPQASTANLPYHHQAGAGPAGNFGGASAGAAKGVDETAARYAELQRREQELADREAKLGQREEHVRRHGRNNWPPRVVWPFAPLLYHDIQEEVPAESRTIVATLYKLWLALLVTLILNLVTAILVLVAGMEDGGSNLGGAIVDLVIGPLAFLLWYRPAYNAYMKETAFYYYIYFIFAGFHILFSCYTLVGIPSTGAAGIISSISCIAGGHIVSGVFSILATVGWGIQSAGSLFMYRFVWKHHNDKGHTFAQAKSDLQMHGIKAYFSRSSNV